MHACNCSMRSQRAITSVSQYWYSDLLNILFISFLLGLGDNSNCDSVVVVIVHL